MQFIISSSFMGRNANLKKKLFKLTLYFITILIKITQCLKDLEHHHHHTIKTIVDKN